MAEVVNGSALLVMDMQDQMLRHLPVEKAAEFVGKVAQAIANARVKKIPVIYVVGKLSIQ
jgi:nicotinamidase-related amidase